MVVVDETLKDFLGNSYEIGDDLVVLRDAILVRFGSALSLAQHIEGDFGIVPKIPQRVSSLDVLLFYLLNNKLLVWNGSNYILEYYGSKEIVGDEIRVANYILNIAEGKLNCIIENSIYNSEDVEKLLELFKSNREYTYAKKIYLGNSVYFVYTMKASNGKKEVPKGGILEKSKESPWGLWEHIKTGGSYFRIVGGYFKRFLKTYLKYLIFLAPIPISYFEAKRSLEDAIATGFPVVNNYFEIAFMQMLLFYYSLILVSLLVRYVYKKKVMKR